MKIFLPCILYSDDKKGTLYNMLYLYTIPMEVCIP